MTREQAEKIVWDFAGLNREISYLGCWDKAPSRALKKKTEELAEQLIQALLIEDRCQC